MPEFLRICIIVCPLVFLAGFIDSVAGGGGIISIPAYFVAGLPTRLALGTNKLVAFCGTSLSAYNYLRKGKSDLKVGAISAVGSIIGSAIGTSLALIIPESILKTALMIIIPIIAIFLAVKKNFGASEGELDFSPVKIACAAFIIGICIGCYDGLIGPGTGTFLIMAFSGILKMDLLKASGCAKISNLASNLASLIIYAINGEVYFLLAIPAAAFCMLGNVLGTKFAIRGGSKNVRKVMFVVLALLIVKTVMDMLGITFGG